MTRTMQLGCVSDYSHFINKLFTKSEDRKVISFVPLSHKIYNNIVVNNLIDMISELNKKALFVDFTDYKNAGLQEILYETRSISDSIRKSESDKFDILSAGINAFNSSSILSHKNYKNLLNSLKQKYDIVILWTDSVHDDKNCIDYALTGDMSVIFIDKYFSTKKDLLYVKKYLTNMCGALVIKSFKESTITKLKRFSKKMKK